MGFSFTVEEFLGGLVCDPEIQGMMSTKVPWRPLCMGIHPQQNAKGARVASEMPMTMTIRQRMVGSPQRSQAVVPWMCQLS